MKKITLSMIFAILLFPNIVLANTDESSIGLKLGLGQNNPQTLKEVLEGYGGTLTKSNVIYGIEVSRELSKWQDDENKKLGLKVVWEMYGENKWSRSGYYVSENTFAIPISLYYKYDKGEDNISLWGGGGFTFIYTSIENTAFYDVPRSGYKLSPHITGGAEYRMKGNVALGLDLKYNFLAKVEKNRDEYNYILSDRSGFSAALAFRFYFKNGFDKADDAPVKRYESVNTRTEKEKYNNDRNYYEYY